MASLKGLFLAVYASNGIIRMLFLPIWYTLLLSPFLAVVAYYYGVAQTLRDFVGEDFSWFDVIPQFAISAVFVLLPTRLLSGSGSLNKSKNGGKSRVQPLPYWVPGVRHLGSIASGGQEWLRGIRDSSINSIFSYKAAGAKHNVMLSDFVLEQIYKNQDDIHEYKVSRWAILRNAFGMPKGFEAGYFDCQSKIQDTIDAEMFKSRSMEALISASCKVLSDSLPDLVTFNSSIVDQMQWERVATIELTDGTSEAECDFFILINEFCCNAILGPIAGTQFPESYQLLASDLADLNRHYYALSLGIPRLSPIQGLPTATLAKKRLLQNFTNLFWELTEPKVRRVPDDDESMSGEETDADTSTPLATLNELFNKQNVPVPARASIILELIHGITAEIVPLVFWSLLHVYASSTDPPSQSNQETPFEMIKEETKSWAQAIQPPMIHPLFPAPPEISFASIAEAVTSTSFPYLRSCINEARRLYSSSATIYTVIKPTTLIEKSLSPDVKEQWELDAGSYIDVGLSRSLINTSPANYTSPEAYKPDRFINTTPGASVISPDDSSESYKTALLVCILAGIIQLWEISPAPKKTFMEKMIEVRDEVHAGAASMNDDGNANKNNGRVKKEGEEEKKGVWVVPSALDAAIIKVPKSDVRVRIRRREDLPPPKSPRKR